MKAGWNRLTLIWCVSNGMGILDSACWGIVTPRSYAASASDDKGNLPTPDFSETSSCRKTDDTVNESARSTRRKVAKKDRCVASELETSKSPRVGSKMDL